MLLFSKEYPRYFLNHSNGRRWMGKGIYMRYLNKTTIYLVKTCSKWNTFSCHCPLLPWPWDFSCSFFIRLYRIKLPWPLSLSTRISYKISTKLLLQYWTELPFSYPWIIVFNLGTNYPVNFPVCVSLLVSSWEGIGKNYPAPYYYLLPPTGWTSLIEEL